ncbi:MAG: peptidylprolyl isomerase [Deltaproteobacteria bacterium]|nr:peptidylprolyl isomerase [Deltaproteobacteria bacterium]
MTSLFRSFASGLVLLVLFAGCHSKGRTLVKVGGEEITEADLDKIVRANPRLKGRMSSPEGKQKLLENYVEQILLYQEGLRRNLQRDEATRDRIDLYKKMIVAQAALDNELDKKVRDYYDNHKDEFERLKLSHIYVSFTTKGEEAAAKKAKKTIRTAEQALAIVQKLKERLGKGEAFEKVAEQASEDERTKKIGGTLGYVTLSDKRLEGWGWSGLIEKALLLKEGELSDPITSKNGVHLIKVLEEKKMEPLDQAEARIRFRIQGTVRDELLADLKKKTRVKYLPDKETPKPPESLPVPESAPSGGPKG